MILVSVGGVVESCGGFCCVPGPLQTVQRTKFWRVILALQASEAVHLGVDNLNVVRHVVACWMVVAVPALLSCRMMVILSC